MSDDTSPTSDLTAGEDYPEIRDAVAKLCAEFPGEYWRELEKQPASGSYPDAFVAALTDGTLEARITREYELSEIATAHADMIARRTTGTVVVTFEG